MAVKFGTNISSLTAQRRLAESTSALSKTYEKLSGGLRINKASDDAAGLAIAKTLNAQGKIFGQAIRNLNDGISYTGIAGSALQELKGILLRQQELAAQAANGTYSDAQRTVMNQELGSLSSEWNRILDGTTFNGRAVFSANEGSLTLQGGVGTESMLQAAFGSAEAAAQDDMVRVSVAPDGSEGNDDSDLFMTLSSDGRHVVFASVASNLVAGDTAEGLYDVYVRDLGTGIISKVSCSTSPDGVADGNSLYSTISADGRYVAFTSDATNLVEGDTNGLTDLFLRDLHTGVTTMVTRSFSGGMTDGDTRDPSFSADGRYLVFESDATNLVSSDGNGATDIFVTDLQTGLTRKVTNSSSGGETDASSFDASISADERYVTYLSDATNIVDDDLNTKKDVFVTDLETGLTQRVSVSTVGDEGNEDSGSSVISGDGRYVAFASSASNLIEGGTNGMTYIFVRDLRTGETSLASGAMSGAQANGNSSAAGISDDGRFVSFRSTASNLVQGDGNGRVDVFVRDRQTGETRKLSNAMGGGDTDANSSLPAISGDGRYVTFYSSSTNLVPGDSGNFADVFVVGNSLAEWSTVSRSQWISIGTRAEALLSQDRLDSYLAIEVTALTRSQILQHVSTSILAQANLHPRIALQLLSA